MSSILSPEELVKKERLFKLIGLWETAINAEEIFIPTTREIFMACEILLFAILDSNGTSIQDARDIFQGMFNTYRDSEKRFNYSSSFAESRVDQPEHLDS